MNKINSILRNKSNLQVSTALLPAENKKRNQIKLHIIKDQTQQPSSSKVSPHFQNPSQFKCLQWSLSLVICRWSQRYFISRG